MTREDLLCALNAAGWDARTAALSLHVSIHTVYWSIRWHGVQALRPCSVCGRVWDRTGNRRVCSDACRVHANRTHVRLWKRRRAAAAQGARW